ncbi:phenylalanine--tRNA ligase subunit beta [Candidatus Saccharibacteria bacterium]|nr:phenylalanine--tRNA ligase subunit beta [Candidatus Saccharibacteria bacterium]
MKVSLNVIKQLINFELPPVDELAQLINRQLGKVDRVENLAERYRGACVVRVVECAKHPNADRLSVTKIDDGMAVPDVPRDENGLVQVVCGAPNVQAGMWAVWLPPASTVPASILEGEPFTLDARKLRGVLSQGMLAAADELAIGTDHEGIVALTPHDLPAGKTLQPGADFAALFGLDDYVLDIENKMFTHRPDCFGQLGVAREIAGILHQPFTSPTWYNLEQVFGDGDSVPLAVSNDIPQLVPRFMAVAIRDVQVAPSPFWLQCQLVAMGAKPINNIVDATNYVMLMTAQPTHAYDYDTLHGGQLGVRMAHRGETLALLSGKTIELTPDDIVIADGQGPVALGGIMGGSRTEVSATTTTIVLECATFDMYAVRKTAMRHGVFTDALARFNKGQSPLQNAAVLNRLIGMVGGEQASPVIDIKPFTSEHGGILDEYFAGKYEPATIDITSRFINQRLGSHFTENDICTLLNNVEIHSHGPENELGYICLQVPFWRTDLETKEDIVEEIGRLHGFDTVPRQLPMRRIQPAGKNPRRELKRVVREALAKAGANEVLSYSFVHERVLKGAGQDPAQAFRLSNALSPDLQYYRLSVLPSLLDKVHANIKAGHSEFMLFEIGKGHTKARIGEDGLPAEQSLVDLVYSSKKPRAGAAFYHVRAVLDQLARDSGLTLVYTPVTAAQDDPVYAPFDINRSAHIWVESSETTGQPERQLIGVVGELRPAVVKHFKLPDYTAAASLRLDVMEQVWRDTVVHYQPISRYPTTTRDISIQTSIEVTYDELVQAVLSAMTRASETYPDVTIRDLTPLSIYKATPDASHQTTTFRLTLSSSQATLSAERVRSIIRTVFAPKQHVLFQGVDFGE